MKKSLFFLLIVSLLACRKEQTVDNKDVDSAFIVVDTAKIKRDTVKNNENIEKKLILTDTQVIFFMPSSKDQVKLIKFYGIYDDYVYRNMFTNFKELERKVKNELKKNNIPVEVSNAKKFVFIMNSDTMIYDLDVEQQIMGYILFDGQNSPLIRPGLQKNKRVSEDLRNYFNIKNFKLE